MAWKNQKEGIHSIYIPELKNKMTYLLNNYIKTNIYRSARALNITVTALHEKILAYAYKYYQENKVGPLIYNFKKNLGISKTDLQKLFPYGLNSVYAWVGIPIQSTEQPCKSPVEIKAKDYRFVYLDNNATTYVREEVAHIIKTYFSGKFGYANPSSSTIQGKTASDIIQTARMTIAQCFSCDTDEIIFTGSGSEANNTAIKGLVFQYLNQPGHIITSKIEHSSILRTMEYLETLGFKITYLDVPESGVIKLKDIKNNIRENTIFICVMAVNNEIGTISPIAEIGQYCQQMGIPFMVDAIQALGKIHLSPKEMGISMMSFSGHKIYAPKGVAGLFIDHDFNIVPLVHGGGQELGMRSGTENVAYIKALAKAVKLAVQEREKEHKRIQELKDYFLTKMKNLKEEYIINGDLDQRIPNNISIGFRGVDTSALVLSLNSIGICVSAGSACSSGKNETSHVLKAINADTTNYGSIRISFGLKTTHQDLDYFFKYLPEILTQLRKEK